MKSNSIDLDILQFLRYGLLPWPIVVVIEDRYVPGHVKQVVEAAREADSSLVGAIVACRSYQGQRLFPQQLN